MLVSVFYLAIMLYQAIGRHESLCSPHTGCYLAPLSLVLTKSMKALSLESASADNRQAEVFGTTLPLCLIETNSVCARGRYNKRY